MKFFWKIYFSYMILLLTSFGVFGTWMIQRTFNQSYQKVLEEGERENRMFQLSFEMNMNALADVDQRDALVPVVVSSIAQNMSGSGYRYRIYNEDQEVQYETEPGPDLSKKLRASLNDAQSSGYMIVKRGNTTYMFYTCRSDILGASYFLETFKNITSIYEERESYFDWYTMVMLILIAVSTLVVLIITIFLTRSIDDLSKVTRKFTSGDLEARASEEGGDEIAELAYDFNDMADTITEKMEELRLQAKKQEDFTASFAHELKTPLTSIIGYADMLQTVECTKEEQQEAVHYIFQQGKRLESLSFKLLDLIVADKQDYDFNPVPIETLTEEAARLTKERRESKEIRLEVDVEPYTLSGEKDMLLSMIVNLLDNAAKAVSRDGIIRIRGKNYKNHYLLCVSDNGCGMTQEDASRITEAFYMADKSRARREGGAGLGMTLVNRIVDLHNAKMRIFSIKDKGTAIAIRFNREEI